MQLALFGSLFFFLGCGTVLDPRCRLRRFALDLASIRACSYAFLGAVIFAAWVPGYWTHSPSGQHLMVAALYCAGLVTVAAARPRHRFTFLDSEYSLAEALLWFGIYLAMNLQLSTVDMFGHWWGGDRPIDQFSKPFYWASWGAIWCLPPVILGRGMRRKDRFVMAAGAIAAILTLVTNKPYLGWRRQTWDPMLLGTFLIGAALLIRRWLAKAPGGIRYGFTAQRLSGKDKGWMSIGAAAMGLTSGGALAPREHSDAANFHFGGGDSGGGGATSDF